MKTPLVPSDLFSLVTVSDPQITADGSAIYYRRTTLDAAADKAVGNVWRVDRDGAASVFTSGRNDRLARPAPRGSHVAFVREEDEKARVYLIATGGGEARALGPVFPKIAGLAWSPDGSRIAVAAATEHNPHEARVFHDEPSGARHIRSLPFKSDSDGLLDGTRKHLFVLTLATEEVQRITAGDFDVSGPSWSPDGTHIAFHAAIDLPEWSFGSDIHVVELVSKKIRTFTTGNGPMNSPAWSHDGKTIAFYGHEHGDDAGGRFNTELLLVDLAEGSAVRSLSVGLDRTVGDSIISDMRSGFVATPPIWTAGDLEILVQVSDEGTCGLRAFPRSGSAPHVLASGLRDIYSFSRASDGTIALAFSDMLQPGDIAVIDTLGIETRLTNMNADFLATKAVVEPQRFRPIAKDGTKLDGWLMTPLDRTGELPIVLQVHGGPHVAYGHSFFFEFQVLAGTGCAVTFGNPRGGQSYGHAYANAILGDWGGIDAEDVHAILDGALELGTFDRARIGVAGGSYGGFMTTWLLGHSDRFAAGVSMRAVNDFVSEAGASDLGWFLEREIGAPPLMSDGGKALFDASPMRAAHKIDAPLLVEHSERDYRCPIDQGEQLFTLLRRLGKKHVEFVRFTGDGHELSRGGKPRNRILRLRAIAHWFIRHLRPGIEPVADTAGALFTALEGENDLVVIAS